MASKYVDALISAATILDEEGYDYTAGLVEQAARRMRDMEELIVSLQGSVERMEEKK